MERLFVIDANLESRGLDRPSSLAVQHADDNGLFQLREQAAANRGHAEQEGDPSKSPSKHFCLCDRPFAYQVE
jgi:hypothetical protein